MIDQVINFEEMGFGLFRKLSECLEISFAEIIDLMPVVMPVHGRRKSIKGYKISFRSNAPAEILVKIKNLSPDHTVYLMYYQVNDLGLFNEIKNYMVKENLSYPKITH